MSTVTVGAEPLPSSSGPSLKRWSLRVGIAALIGFGAVAAAKAGLQWWRAGRFFETTDDAYVGGEITVLAAKVPGFIAQMAVTDNQVVHAGDLLVKLDDRDYRAALAKADAAVAGQEAALRRLRATRNLQPSLIAQAQAGVEAADAEQVRARDDQARFTALVASGSSPRQSSDKADAEYKQAIAASARARASVEAAHRELDIVDSQRDQLAAALDAAIAERETARLNLSYTELRAPIDGVIGNRSGRNGAFTAAGAQLLAIVPARGLWVDANFKESELASMSPGQPARIEADLFPGEIFRGHVESVAPATGAQFSVLPPENATGNFTKIVQRVPVRIALDGDASILGRLRPGLSVIASVDERAAAPVILGAQAIR